MIAIFLRQYLDLTLIIHHIQYKDGLIAQHSLMICLVILYDAYICQLLVTVLSSIIIIYKSY